MADNWYKFPQEIRLTENNLEMHQLCHLFDFAQISHTRSYIMKYKISDIFRRAIYTLVIPILFVDLAPSLFITGNFAINN